MSDTDRHPPPPGLIKLALEGRAPWEFAALLASTPWQRRLPAGDGHAVIVFPGLGAPDLSTLPLRRFLRERGYAPQPWGLGFNLGPKPGVLKACVKLLQAQHAAQGRPVSLLGWSLGGVYAREIAKLHPDLVRCVITLGSPFAGHPRATHAWRFFEFVSGQSTHDEALLAGLKLPPPVPTTSIYSRSDGVVAWQCSLNDAQPLAENIEVHASHIGMGMNPLALYAVADRLAQPEVGWRPFSNAGARRWFFK